MKLNKLVVALAVLLAFVSLGSYAEAACEDTQDKNIRTCNIGTDPVDPSYEWVPPADWRLFKTQTKQPVTMTTGKSGNVTCVAPAGLVYGESPDLKQQVIIQCANQIVGSRRLVGKELPEDTDPQSITDAMEKIIMANLKDFKGPQGDRGPEGPMGPPGICEDNCKKDGGFHWGTKSWVTTGVVAAVATYLILRDDDKFGVKTGPVRDNKCVATGTPTNCKPTGSQGLAISLSPGGKSFRFGIRF